MSWTRKCAGYFRTCRLSDRRPKAAVSNTPKHKFPRAAAIAVAQEVGRALSPGCQRIIVAGSLRRGCAEVGDVELLYIPRTDQRPDPVDLFAEITVNLADEEIGRLEALGVLARRKNIMGCETFGPKNKLMLHVPSGIPVDLFSIEADAWWNNLVCRTGPADSNTRIAMAAQRKGWHWQPYSPGFFRDGHIEEMHSEQEVFAFAGLHFPRNRVEVPL
jgi:DNA polymerase/3'-5' exonuclease PolX